MLGVRVILFFFFFFFNVASDATKLSFDGFFFSDYSENIYRFGLIPFELWIRMDIFNGHMLHHTVFNRREARKKITFSM